MFDYASGNDEDYQYSYQDEIDSAEFVDVENSQKDSRSRETMPSAEKNTKSMAAEERESWDFIKAKMDQSLSRLGSTPASRNSGEKTEKSSAASQEEKAKKPKGPSAVAVFFGKMKSFTSAAFKKTASIFKRKPKPEKDADVSGKNKPEKKAGLSSQAKPEKKPGIASSAFSFLKKKTPLTDGAKAAHKKDEKTNASGGSTVSKGAKPTPETQLRERRKTYLIIGTITMSIVLLFLTAGILFIVNRSGKSGKSVAQNIEASVQTENSTETPQTDVPSTPVTTTAPDTKPKEPGIKTVPPTPDSDLPLPGIDDGPAEDLDQTIGDILNQDNSTSLADPTDLPAEEKAPEDDPLKISEKEEKTEEPLAEPDFPPVPDASPNTAEQDPLAGDVLEIPALTDPIPETDPLETKDSENAPLQEETPSLNVETTPETGGKDSANDSTPSLLDLPESVSPGSTTVSPTISRSEDQNQPPEEMGTPDGVTPGSNIESWNTPGNTEVADSGPSGNSLDLDTLALDSSNEKEAETAPKEDSLTAELALPGETPSSKTSQPQEPKLDDGLGDLGQLSDLDSVPAPAPAPSLDSDLGSGVLSPSTETLKGQKSPKYTNYTTLKDDTFWKISEKFYQTPAYEKALSRYNSDVVPDPSNLKEGTVLQIPDMNFLRSCYPTLCPQPLQVVQVPTSSDPDQTRGVQYYCVAEGDTLSLIAERFLGDSSRWPEIYRMNASKIQEMDLVQPGLKLRIPADDAIPEQNIWQ